MGGGMTFGAFGGQKEIMQTYNPETANAMPHAGTFNNNTITMAAGCAAMGEVFTANVADALNQRGDQLRQALNQIAVEAAAPIQFTGIGSLMNLHATNRTVSSPADTKSPDDRIKELLFLDLLESGYYIARRGFIALMLSISDQDIEGFKQAFERILSKRKGVLFL